MKRVVLVVMLAALALGGCTYYTQPPTEPVAVIVAVPTSGPAPLDVVFDGTGSRPSIGADIVSYAWDFGDGSLGTGAQVTHTYARQGEYTVTLTVKDSTHKQASSTVVISVGNQPPVIYGISVFGAQSGAGPTFKQGEEITFIAHADDPDGYVRYYYWDFGDGHVDTGSEVTHAYYLGHCGSEPEVFVVTLVVEDNNAQQAVATVEVEVKCGG